MPLLRYTQKQWGKNPNFTESIFNRLPIDTVIMRIITKNSVSRHTKKWL